MNATYLSNPCNNVIPVLCYAELLMFFRAIADSHPPYMVKAITYSRHLEANSVLTKSFDGAHRIKEKCAAIGPQRYLCYTKSNPVFA